MKKYKHIVDEKSHNYYLKSFLIWIQSHLHSSLWLVLLLNNIGSYFFFKLESFSSIWSWYSSTKNYVLISDCLVFLWISFNSSKSLWTLRRIDLFHGSFLYDLSSVMSSVMNADARIKFRRSILSSFSFSKYDWKFSIKSEKSPEKIGF